MRHLMSPLDFSVEELEKLLNLADDIGKNPAAVKNPPYHNRKTFELTVSRPDQGRKTINREHQKRGFAHHGKMASDKRVQPCPENLQTPARKTAQKKILLLHLKAPSHQQKNFSFRKRKRGSLTLYIFNVEKHL
jgi:hypothetical protein